VGYDLYKGSANDGKEELDAPPNGE
jgi:hypothetical protein